MASVGAAAAAVLLTGAVAVIAQQSDGLAGKPVETRPEPKPDPNGYIPRASLAELMDAIVMPAAQGLWDAVSVEVTENGTIEKGPKTDEDWQKLRETALMLAESSNLIIVPGRHAAPPGARSASPDSELEPEQIDALLKAQRAAFVAHAQVLHTAAIEALRAIDARSLERISDAGGTIDAACESCHLQFWYPNQDAPK